MIKNNQIVWLSFNIIFWYMFLAIVYTKPNIGIQVPSNLVMIYAIKIVLAI